MSGMAEDDVMSYARRGSYALQDYAAQYWLDHLRESVNASGTLQSAGCQDAIQSAYLFLQSYGDHAKMSTLDDAGGFPSVDQVVDRIPKRGGERNNYFNIEERTEAIRQAIAKLDEQTFTSGEAKILSGLQGPMNVHKCSKPWCDFFKGNLQTAEAREKHISPHERSLPDDVDEKPEFMDLMLASRRGDTNTIDDLLGARTQKDARQMVNEKDKSTGEAPLYIAAQNGHAQACRALLRWGADANAVVKLLLDTGKVDADPKDRAGQTALHMAAENGHEAVVKLLLDAGKVDANAQNWLVWTTLHIAAAKGYEAVVKLLLDTGKVDADPKDQDGWTALYIAAKNGHETVVKLLLDTGKVDVGAKDKNGRTALDMAAQYRREAVVKLLRLAS
ncbi:hypothetical protein N0V85_008692 [Neurospora sp. IMI 360204]|nr:hypothetical protein N0V85_008692 [Neurospora sp. IMI 360204]